jgi:hypothetical protein
VLGTLNIHAGNESGALEVAEIEDHKVGRRIESTGAWLA